MPKELVRFYTSNEGIGCSSSPEYPVRIAKLKELKRVDCPDILVLKELPVGWERFSGIRIGLDSFLDDFVYVVSAPCCPSGAIMLFGPDVAGPGGSDDFRLDPSLVLAHSFTDWLRNLERWSWIEYGAAPGSLEQLQPADALFLRHYYRELNPHITW